ncbi:hypothetical protein C0993_002724 [Termitomyces sp. T159_Od127]|nr:hypothetical protein C0993_002724 [Termitomyces sp. T159_Od127]
MLDTSTVPEIAAGPPETAATPESIANAVFAALQKDLVVQLQTSLGEIHASLEVLGSRVEFIERGACGCGPRPSISPPEKYDGASKALVDQFVRQVEAVAEFEVFRDDHQKILWAQSYLMGSAQAWSCIITMGSADPGGQRGCRTFWMRDMAQEALNGIAVLQQGSRSITEYCMAFFKLKGRLSPSDAGSDCIKDRLWKGLSAAAMEALVNTDYDYEMAEQARDILLRWESKLADIAAHRKGTWQATGMTHPWVPTPAVVTPSTTTAVRVAPPHPPVDANTMDVNHTKATPVQRECFKCKKLGHLMVECPQWAAAIKVAVREAITGGDVKVEEAPKAGFV